MNVWSDFQDILTDSVAEIFLKIRFGSFRSAILYFGERLWEEVRVTDTSYNSREGHEEGQQDRMMCEIAFEIALELLREL